MQYDPIKKGLGNMFNRRLWMRKLFYRLLDLLLLRSWHIHRAVHLFARHKKSPFHVLDAGAGFGQYTYWLARKYPHCEILAVDVKKDQVEDCSRFFRKIGMNNVEFREADLTAFTSEQTFDLVLSVDVMEHILEDVTVFQNLYRVMNPDGLLLISTPSDQGGSDVHDHGSEESFIDEHVRDGYGIKEIRDKLMQAGFSRVEADYSYGWPGKISWKLSMKYPIMLLNASRLFYLILPFWYLVFYPVCWILNSFDVALRHRTGTGLIVKAWK
ncbi:MAG: class I SAM-dependent methyltransferase [Bacteroidales bacterium]